VTSLVDRDTMEGVLIVALSNRKARQGGGLGRTGEPDVFRKGCVRKLPVGPGTGEAVPASMTKDVRDWHGRGQGCSSR
jgi:hypothetical protein